MRDLRDPHRTGSSLSDVVLGGQDGLVNVLGVVLGVAAATSDTRVVLAAGLAGALAESVSMAAVAFTSTQTRAAHFESEREREQRHIRLEPELEREEIRVLYRARGFEGELLEKVVDVLTSNRDVWVRSMLTEELGLQPVDDSAALRSAVVVGVAALVGSLIPLLPFLLLDVRPATVAALAFGAVTLAAFGAFKARVTVGSPLRGAVSLAAIGIVSALVGYAAGWIFRI